jgi:hypothetical protein
MQREAKRAKRTKKAKFQSLFAFFAYSLPSTMNSDFENVPDIRVIADKVIL